MRAYDLAPRRGLRVIGMDSVDVWCVTECSPISGRYDGDVHLVRERDGATLRRSATSWAWGVLSGCFREAQADE